MKKQLLILIAFFSISNLYAQDIFIGTAKNFTSYDFTVNNIILPTTPDYRSVSGSFYEIGYSPNDPDKNLSYLVSLTYNEFNAAASKDLSSYSWNTCYLGLQNAIEYSFFESKSGIKLSINAGLNTAVCNEYNSSIPNLPKRCNINLHTSRRTLAKQSWLSGVLQ